VRPDALRDSPKPVEDRLLNAMAVLTLGVIVTAVAGFSFLVVTESRVEALAPFISQPWAAPPTASASSSVP
jgi:predicted amino acid dehydrogenase